MNSDSIEVELSADLLSGQVCIGADVRGELYKIAGQGEILNPDRLDNLSVGKILFGGQMVTKEFLQRAKNLDVKAVLCGGIDQSLVQELTKTDNFPTLLLIEGYGNFALGRDIFELLIRREKKAAFVDSAKNRLVIPSLETVRHEEEKLATFKPLMEFDRVRVLDFVRGSEVGTVTAVKKIFNQKALLPTEVALVKLDTGKMIETFASNLEILVN